MVNKRMLAVAAVLVLAIPTLGAAATIYVANPVPEQLVEGHTVFTVIQVQFNTTTAQARFAAAVAVLVRENVNQNANVRFPGVLWFNDQYLVNPNGPQDNVYSYRYPCGGAVIAVNHNDPDPRLIAVNAAGTTVNPVRQPPTSAQPYDLATGVAYSTNQSLAGVDPSSGTPYVYSDTVFGTLAGADYKESYLITDPNDHAWIIDRYNGYTRTGTGGLQQSIYNFPVWVVNMMGTPAFVPDDGVLSCFPYLDEAVTAAYDGACAATTAANSTGAPVPPTCLTGPLPSDVQRGAACQVNTMVDAPVATDMPAKDKPCAGWNEGPGGAAGANTAPYCYQGSPVGSASPQYPTGRGANCADEKQYPKRLYNALLYMKLEDLNVAGAVITHDGTNTDTNGCQIGTEWACPADDDAKEGNSHPFNPIANSATAPSNAPQTYMACPNPYGSNTVNHGGSEQAAPGTQYNPTTKGPYDYKTDSPGVYYDPGCSHQHATRQIDLYFDAAARPMPPVIRNFDVQDTQGSSAPFAGTGDGSVDPSSPGPNWS